MLYVVFSDWGGWDDTQGEVSWVVFAVPDEVGTDPMMAQQHKYLSPVYSFMEPAVKRIYFVSEIWQ